MARFLPILVLLCAACLQTEGAAAETVGVPTVSYPAGYSMVGAPAGTSLAAAAQLYAYSNGSYLVPSTSSAAACAGYWAYFLSPATVTLATPDAGATRVCPLRAGWNMVGNPFNVDAALPAGVVGYLWSHDRATYDRVAVIPAGSAVWILSPTESQVLLTAVATSPPARTPATITITDVVPGPYTIHVGDSVKLVILASNPSNVTVDQSFLRIDSAGQTYELSCAGDPACALNGATQFWIARAVAPGNTTITITPTCGAAGCGLPPHQVAISILP